MSYRQAQIDEETHERLKALAEKHGISLKEIIDYLSKLAVQHGLLDPDWQERITSDKLKEYEEKLSKSHDFRSEEKKMDWTMRFKFMLLTKYVDSLQGNDRKAYIETVMGYLKGEGVLERLTSLEMVTLDGIRRFMAMIEGKPDVGMERDKLMKCPKGWHVKGRWCKCDAWRTCEMKAQEMAEHQVQQLYDRQKILENKRRRQTADTAVA